MRAGRNMAIGLALGALACVPAGAQTTTTGAPGPIEVVSPSVSGRTAYVSQIGNANEATVSQTAPDARISIRQDGDRNVAAVTQSGEGIAFGDIAQTGADNEAALAQQGSGTNVLYLAQTGTGNRAAAQQSAEGALLNGAIMNQIGAFNQMSLFQDGSDNRAALTQEGDSNQMTAAQTGVGNRLIWTQQGNNLSNLGITQTGAQAIQITQTGN